MITANDIKTRGVKAIADALQERDHVPITVRGKVKYVVMQVEDYDEFRTQELDQAYQEVMKDYKEGNFVLESAQEHIQRLSEMLSSEDA